MAKKSFLKFLSGMISSGISFTAKAAKQAQEKAQKEADRQRKVEQKRVDEQKKVANHLSMISSGYQKVTTASLEKYIQYAIIDNAVFDKMELARLNGEKTIYVKAKTMDEYKKRLKDFKSGKLKAPGSKS